MEDIQQPKRSNARRSPSPTPPSADIPSFLPTGGGVDVNQKQEQELKDKFKTFWMTTIVDAFQDDLEEIRKEPNMDSSRLALLIDSLASGADIFASNSKGSEQNVNEMEIVLEGQS